MSVKFFYEDLNESALCRLRLIVRDKLQEKIAEAVDQHGVDPEQAETELVDEHLNRHNFGFVVET